MKFVVLLVIMSVGFVLSFPRKHQYPAIDNVYDDEVDNEEVNDIVHQIFKKSISAHPPNSENAVNPEGTVQEPCRLTLPTLELSSDTEIPQDLYIDDGVLPTAVIPPRVPDTPYFVPSNNWTPYDFDYLVQEPAHYRAPYNSYNMPYFYSNPVPPVRSLPPVISTRIHETIPDEIDDGFDMNGLSDSDVYFPPYVRAVRSRDDDFLDQLEKDAMMPNLLPTMPFPYMRSAPQGYPTHGEGGNIPVALFPPGSGSDCALPFLVSCTPKIFHGSLTQNVYGANPINSALATYRKDGASGYSNVKPR